MLEQPVSAVQGAPEPRRAADRLGSAGFFYCKVGITGTEEVRGVNRLLELACGLRIRGRAPQALGLGRGDLARDLHVDRALAGGEELLDLAEQWDVERVLA